MAYQGTSKLDEVIRKYGGGDAAYELDLKKKIREGMGYSNYLSKQNALMGSDVDLPDVEGMTPAGIKSMVSGAIGIQEGEMNSLDKILGGVDSAAGSLAGSLAAKSRAGGSGNKTGFENNVLFQPKDSLDVDILNSVQQAWNANQSGNRGDIKSLQQLEAEVIERWKAQPNQGQEDQRGITSYDLRGTPEQQGENKPMYSEQEIRDRIRERLPQDYVGNEGKYMLMMRGFSENQADDNAKAMNYYSASGPVQQIYEQTNPKLVAMLKQEPGFPTALNQALETDDKGDPVHSMEDLIKDNKEVTPDVIKEQLSPIYKDHATKFVGDFLSQPGVVEGETMADSFKNAYVNGNEKEVSGLNGIKGTKTFAELVTIMNRSYRGVFETGELENFLLDQIEASFNNPQQVAQQAPQMRKPFKPYTGGFQF